MSISNDKIELIKEQIYTDMLNFHNYEFKGYIEDYKSYVGDVSDKLKYKDDWMNNVSEPLVYMMVDTVFGTVFDFDFQLKVKEPTLEAACIDAYDFNNNAKRTLGLAAKEALITGTGIMRDYTYREEGQYEGLGETIDYEIKSPTMEYVSIFNVMYDRMKGLKNSNYKIIRQFLTETEITNRILSREKDKTKRTNMLNNIRKLKDKNMAFSMYNYEAIKGLIFTTNFIDSMKDIKGKLKKSYNTNINPVNKPEDLNYNNDGFNLGEASILESPYYNDFTLKYEVVEFIEGNKKYVFINGEHIVTETINKHIYNLVSINFNEIPGSGRSIGISKIIKQLADSSNGLMNMFLDSLKLSNTLVFKTKAPLQKKNAKLDIRSGMIIGDGMERVNLGGGDFSGMNGVQSMQQIAQAVLGINQMIMGGDSRVQRIAGAFDFAFSQYKARLTPFTDSIDSAMTTIVKGWISQYLYLYEQKELEDLYGMEFTKIKEKGKVVDIQIGEVSMKDILNESNISFKFDSMYNLKKDNDKKIAMDIFQVAEQYNNSKVDREAFIKLMSGDQNVKLQDVLGIGKDENKLDDVNNFDINNLDLLQNNKEDTSLDNIINGGNDNTPNNTQIEEPKLGLDTINPNEQNNAPEDDKLLNKLL